MHLGDHVLAYPDTPWEFRGRIHRHDDRRGYVLVVSEDHRRSAWISIENVRRVPVDSPVSGVSLHPDEAHAG